MTAENVGSVSHKDCLKIATIHCSRALVTQGYNGGNSLYKVA